MRIERIYCAAIKGPLGTVWLGFRHHRIIADMGRQHPHSLDVQGFMTNQSRFVDRVEARAVAFRAGQVSDPSGRLFSEDLW